MREGLQSCKQYVSLDLTSDIKELLLDIGDCNGMEHLIGWRAWYAFTTNKLDVN